MSRVKGPFEAKWGANTLTDIEEVGVDWDQDSESFSTIQHNRFEEEGGLLVKITLTLLRSDIPALAAVLPQFFKANGETMSTGFTVEAAEGAIDYAAQCEGYIYHDLDLISCGNPGQTMRLVNARTRINDVDNGDKLRKVMVEFVGEPEGGQAAVQFFTEGGLSDVS